MNKLDQHFKNWKPETKVVVVGSSPSLCWYKFGKYVDMFDMVVRLNRCFDESTYEYTGKKIDVWATTSNERWNLFNPINESTKEVWPRLPKGEEELTRNGTLSNFKGKVVNMRTKRKKCVFGSNTFDKFGYTGLGTGLIALNYAIHRFDRITAIGHTFYLESENGLALNFDSGGVQDKAHEKDVKNYFDGDKFRLNSLSYLQKWILNDKLLLLNPYELDNLRSVKEI